MQAVRSKGSKIETAFAKTLWARGLRYRKNDKTVFGKPDLTFKKRKIAIFIDSEFGTAKTFWKEKTFLSPTENFGLLNFKRTNKEIHL